MALETADDSLASYFASFDSNSFEDDPFLNALTAALHDPSPRWDLNEIVQYAFLHDGVELNALDLVPLLWANFDKEEATFQLLKLTAERASSKECLIALLEVQESLIARLSVDGDEEDGNNGGKHFCILLDLYSDAIPRISLRKKGPLETLKPIIQGIAQCLCLVRTIVSKDVGRALLQSLAGCISASSSWVTKAQPTTDAQKDCGDLLRTLLFSGVASLCKHTHCHLSEGFIEKNYPQKYLRSTMSPDSVAGAAVMAKLIDTATSIRITQTSLEALATSSENPSVLLSSVVLLAHWNHPLTPSSLSGIIPHLTKFLQNGTATDETFFLLLRHAHDLASGSTPTATAVPIASIIQPLVTFCSTNPDPIQRNTAFVTLSELLRTLPSPERLALLTELLSPETDPFPQMRVAAVVMVKDAVDSALVASQSASPASRGKDVFASTQLLAQIGRYVLRSEPPELLMEKPEKFDANAFLESSEPARLAQCLNLYYFLLSRDVSNLTGIRDTSTVKETSRYLLTPLGNILDEVDTRINEKGKEEMQMSTIPLRVVLERIHEALGTL